MKVFIIQYEVEYDDDRLSDNGTVDVTAENEDEAIAIFESNETIAEQINSWYENVMAFSANAIWEA